MFDSSDEFSPESVNARTLMENLNTGKVFKPAGHPRCQNRPWATRRQMFECTFRFVNLLVMFSPSPAPPENFAQPVMKWIPHLAMAPSTRAAAHHDRKRLRMPCLPVRSPISWWTIRHANPSRRGPTPDRCPSHVGTDDGVKRVNEAFGSIAQSGPQVMFAIESSVNESWIVSTSTCSTPIPARLDDALNDFAGSRTRSRLKDSYN